MKKIKYGCGLVLILLFFGVSGCGGGGQGGGGGGSDNMGMIPVSGTLASVDPSPSTAAMVKSLISVAGITVIATDETGNLVQTTTQDTGSFTLNLPPGHTYVISFFLQNDFLGVLVFKVSATGDITTRFFHLKPEDGAVSLGQITCAAGVCVGDVNPLCQLDEDDDGSMDCDDADDDNDGIDDDNEADEDHDGIIDDDDDDENPMVTGCQVIRMEPFNGETGVSLDGDIKVRFSSQLDLATVTPDTFNLMGPAGVVATNLEVETESEHEGLLTELELEPLADLEPLTTYTVHVGAAITCADGTPLEGATDITFTTGVDNSGSSEEHDD